VTSPAAFWAGRRVLMTGHSGFKGAWLSLWLHRLGAQVSGLSLPEPVSTPSLWPLLGLEGAEGIATASGDVRDIATLRALLSRTQPEVVFHLAAQSLVRPSYDDPVGTFATNVMGTVNLLQAVAETPSVRACVVVTSDKCYENLERERGYVETDRMGGHDPYSASKGCAELATASMRRSFFTGRNGARIASARAGNVIGGGDWSRDRLVPDIVRGCLGPEGQVVIRAPRAVRPWQHVLEPLWGYMLLARHLAEGREGVDTGWNFGPGQGAERPVIEVAEAFVRALGRGEVAVREERRDLHEATLLRLDATRARALGWRPVWDFDTTVEMTARWYAQWAAGADVRAITLAQIEHFERDIFGK